MHVCMLNPDSSTPEAAWFLPMPHFLTYHYNATLSDLPFFNLNSLSLKTCIYIRLRIIMRLTRFILEADARHMRFACTQATQSPVRSL